MQRRQFLRIAGASGIATSAAPLFAQSGAPPLRIVLGFAPGGSTDTVARLLGEQLRVALGRPVVVENKAGAAGRLAVDAVKAAPANGNTLLLAPHGAMTLFPHIYKSLSYDPTKHFIPVTRVTASEYCIAVSAQSQPNDIVSLKQWAKTQGDKLTFGSPGAGTVLHFLGMEIGRGLGISMTHIPYRGAAPALVDLLGGVVNATVTPIADPLPMHKAGKVRILATTGAMRTRLLEGVPTMKEAGVDLDVTAWLGLYAPAGVPVDAVEKLHAAVRQALQAPAMQDQLATIGMVAAPNTSSELLALQRAETRLWGSVVKASGFTPED